MSPAARESPEAHAAPPHAGAHEHFRAVYGLSRKAITSNDGEILKAGNTVAKAPDEEVLKPGDADSLPTPTDEYLVTRMPELASEARIPYPPEAQKKNVEGPVVMDILIDQAGAVRDAKLVSGPGAGLNEAALTAVRNFKFKPALLQDKPVAVRIRYAYRFVLQK
ncbi:MAG: energy transducer TonB [Deltaproteobacteria bacterium]|nr:energy transducer TonB [Deltaproteobacteria bacterium]